MHFKQCTEFHFNFIQLVLWILMSVTRRRLTAALALSHASKHGSEFVRFRTISLNCAGPIKSWFSGFDDNDLAGVTLNFDPRDLGASWTPEEEPESLRERCLNEYIQWRTRDPPSLPVPLAEPPADRCSTSSSTSSFADRYRHRKGSRRDDVISGLGVTSSSSSSP